jgi:predicted Zn-dependent protease
MDLFVKDLSIHEYLKKFSKRFGEHIPNQNLIPHFFALDSPELNAFAFFGNHVAVHNGLILAVKNEDELAAVLAHETAHITQRHLARMLVANKQRMPLTFMQVLAAIAVGSMGAPDAGIHLATAALAGHTQSMINYTRDHEKEADRIGMQLLHKANFNPQGMPSVFSLLQEQSRYREKPPEYLLTHPLFDSRISDAQNRAQKLSTPEKSDPLLFYLVRAKIKANVDKSTSKKIEQFERDIKQKHYDLLDAEKFGYALVLLQGNRATEALVQLEELAKKYPTEWIIQLSLSETEVVLGNTKTALDRIKNLFKLHPQNYAILIQYASMLLKDKQPKAVVKLLFKYRKNSAEDPSAHQLLAQAYSMLKQKTELHRSQAEWYFAKGEINEALNQLNYALETATQRPELRQQILNRKEAIIAIQQQQSEQRI